MDRFMPSEIARLVLGYLKEITCDKTYKSFLSECCDLVEYKQQLNLGREYPTTSAGKSLLCILDEYYRLVVKGGVPSSSNNSAPVESTATSCKISSNNSAPVELIATLCKISSNNSAPVESTATSCKTLQKTPPPTALQTKLVHTKPAITSSNHFFSGKPPLCFLSMHRFKTPHETNSGIAKSSGANSSKGHQTEPAEQNFSPLPSMLKQGPSSCGISEQEKGSNSGGAVLSVTAARTASTLYINQSVQTTDSSPDNSISEAVPTATSSPVHLPQNNQAGANSSIISTSPKTSNSPSLVRTTVPCEENKLSEGIPNHSTIHTETLTEGRNCSRSNVASSDLLIEESSAAERVPPPPRAFAMTPATRFPFKLERCVIPSFPMRMKQPYGDDFGFRSPKKKRLYNANETALTLQ